MVIFRASSVLYLKIKKYKLKDAYNILSSEFPIDEPITDTKMSSLSVACTLDDSND